MPYTFDKISFCSEHSGIDVAQGAGKSRAYFASSLVQGLVQQVVDHYEHEQREPYLVVNERDALSYIQLLKKRIFKQRHV